MKTPQKRPLYRKVNTTAHGVHHAKGGDYRDQRNSRTTKDDEILRRSMHGGYRRGLDYTPLFKFLLSKCGQAWDDVYSEAVKRLDRSEPIFGWSRFKKMSDSDIFALENQPSSVACMLMKRERFRSSILRLVRPTWYLSAGAAHIHLMGFRLRGHSFSWSIFWG